MERVLPVKGENGIRQRMINIPVSTRLSISFHVSTKVGLSSGKQKRLCSVSKAYVVSISDRKINFLGSSPSLPAASEADINHNTQAQVCLGCIVGLLTVVRGPHCCIRFEGQRIFLKDDECKTVTNESLVTKKISERGILDSRIAFPTERSFPSDSRNQRRYSKSIVLTVIRGLAKY